MKLSDALGAADLILVDMYEINRCSVLPDGSIHLGGLDNEWSCPNQELELDDDGETLLKDASIMERHAWRACTEPPLITLRVYRGLTEDDIE